MLKRFFQIFVLVLCVSAMFSCTACNSTNKVAESEAITELNSPNEDAVLKITATDIKTVRDEDGDGIIVGVRFVVENVFNEDYYLSGRMQSAYVDDIAADKSYKYRLFDDSETTLGGRIAPGKRSEGYWCVEAPKDAEVVEFRFRTDYSSATYLVFIFDIPPAEEWSSSEMITLEQYDQIKTGMTYDEVKEIIGSEGTMSRETGDKGTDDYMVSYTWDGSGDTASFALFTFEGEPLLLTDKRQVGLT